MLMLVLLDCKMLCLKLVILVVPGEMIFFCGSFDVKSLKITAIVCFHTVTFSCVLPQRFYTKSSKDR